MTAPPRKLELHRFLEHVQKLPQVEVLADQGLLHRSLALRAWNYFYLAQIPELRWIPPQAMTLEAGVCRFLVTDRAQDFLDPGTLPPEAILPVKRYDWREAEIQIFDLCGSGVGRLRK